MEQEINTLVLESSFESRFEESLSHILHSEYADLNDNERQGISFWFAKNGIGLGLRVISLMEWEASSDIPAGMGQLFWAARGGDADCILLSAEAPGFSQLDRWGASPLHHWADAKGSQISAGAHVLLGLGLDPLRRDRWGMLPMHWGRDEGVWAWGLAAAWAKGDSEAWRHCGSWAAEDAMALLHSGRMMDWARRMGMASGAGEAPRRRSFESRSAFNQLAWGAMEPQARDRMRSELAQRSMDIGKISEAQNCIAKSLGIELLARRSGFIE